MPLSSVPPRHHLPTAREATPLLKSPPTDHPQASRGSYCPWALFKFSLHHQSHPQCAMPPPRVVGGMLADTLNAMRIHFLKYLAHTQFGSVVNVIWNRMQIELYKSSGQQIQMQMDTDDEGARVPFHSVHIIYILGFTQEPLYCTGKLEFPKPHARAAESLYFQDSVAKVRRSGYYVALSIRSARMTYRQTSAKHMVCRSAAIRFPNSEVTYAASRQLPDECGSVLLRRRDHAPRRSAPGRRCARRKEGDMAGCGIVNTGWHMQTLAPKGRSVSLSGKSTHVSQSRLKKPTTQWYNDLVDAHPHAIALSSNLAKSYRQGELKRRPQRRLTYVIELPIFCSPSTRAPMSSQTRRLRSSRLGSHSLCLTDSVTWTMNAVEIHVMSVDSIRRREGDLGAWPTLVSAASGVHPIAIPYNPSLQLDERASSARGAGRLPLRAHEHKWIYARYAAAMYACGRGARPLRTGEARGSIVSGREASVPARPQGHIGNVLVDVYVPEWVLRTCREHAASIRGRERGGKGRKRLGAQPCLARLSCMGGRSYLSVWDTGVGAHEWEGPHRCPPRSVRAAGGGTAALRSRENARYADREVVLGYLVAGCLCALGEPAYAEPEGREGDTQLPLVLPALLDRVHAVSTRGTYLRALDGTAPPFFGLGGMCEGVSGWQR
ncbi:hypothetical protein DFH09DRAFT_1502784 [Mycena vulgaris]|nr:hypothetical protein DFH09DRAFT_1502784 [Mycena vulgaris]